MLVSCANKKEVPNCKLHTSIDNSRSSSVTDFPCPRKSIASTLALSFIFPADKAKESLTTSDEQTLLG